jgi:hypothetical protein
MTRPIRLIHQYQAIDSAALAGASIAASLTIFSAPGPYYPINGIFGVTLLTILLSYELKRYRQGWQNVAFGMVCGLCSLLIIGFLSEFYLSGLDLKYWEKLQEPLKSNVGTWYMFFCWIALTIFFTFFGMKNAIAIPDESNSAQP